MLDVACGAGCGSRMLAERAKQVIGIDIDEECIAYARATYGHPRVTFMTGDVRNLPLPPMSVEVVVSFETIEHVLEGEACLKSQNIMDCQY